MKRHSFQRFPGDFSKKRVLGVLGTPEIDPVRIGILTPGFSASERDWCIPVLLDLVRTLAATDDVSVVALRYPHHRSPYEIHGARVIPLGGAETRGLPRLALFARALGVLIREIRRQRLDVLHAMWAHEPGFLAGLAGRLTGTPVVVSLLGGELADLPDVDYGGQRSAVNRRLVQGALRMADRVVCGSAWLRDLACRHVPDERLVTLPFGVDTELFHPEAGAGVDPRHLDGDPCLLHVASLVPVKDQDTLLRAFTRVVVPYPGAALHFAGEGELRPHLEQLAGELGIASRVRFLGHVPHNQLPSLYRQADLHFLPSLHDGAPMVVLEAAACGCATVGTPVGYLPELGPAARTVPLRNPRALARELIELLADEPARRQMAVAGQELILSRYRLDQTVDRLRALYLSLI